MYSRFPYIYFHISASVRFNAYLPRNSPTLNLQNSGVGSERRLNYDLGLTLIWKETRFNKVQMIVSNHTPIIGEVNIAR